MRPRCGHCGGRSLYLERGFGRQLWLCCWQCGWERYVADDSALVQRTAQTIRRRADPAAWDAWDEAKIER